ncbi:hypothetical protein FLAG1_09627 [Fusarium langsethiae]|uniref:Uncharacterized protein n=1 Tax=Fusarium langsethiae TaxID=179993 RepID=A0A0M9EQ13_FUSLA|nr:hypothetical protein FLAG1_09627 [Fusarium langsethiae]
MGEGRHSMEARDVQAHGKLASASRIQANCQASDLLFQWIKLGRTLMESPKNVQTRFCLCLQILGLTLLEEYHGGTADNLLSLGERDILSDLFDIDDKEYESLASLGRDDMNLGFHSSALIWILLEGVGGANADPQRKLIDSRYSTEQNQIIFGAAVNVRGPRSTVGVDILALHKALSQSRLCVGDQLPLSAVRDLLETCNKAIEQDWIVIDTVPVMAG